MLVRGVAGVVYNEKIYFSSEYPVGCLFCFDIKKETTRFVKQFSVDKKQGMCHRGAQLYHNTAWFIPWDGCRVVCVELDSMEERYFDIQNHHYKNGHAFADYIVYKENELVLIPSGMKLTTLMIINMKTQQAQCYPDVIPECQCIGAYIWRDLLHFISSDGKVLSEFDLNERKLKVKNTGEKSESRGYASLLRHGEWICLIPYNGSDVTLIHLKTERRETIPLPDPQDAFWSGCVIKDGILLFPGNYNSHFFRINLFSKKGTIIEWSKEQESDHWVCIKEIFSNDKEHLAIGTDGAVYQLNEEGALMKRVNYKCKVEERLKIPKMDVRMLEEYFLQYGPVNESPELPLADLVSVVLEK